MTRELVGEILLAEQEGCADTSFSLDRRFELLVRLRSPTGEWRWVGLRLHNRIDDPAIDGMVLQLTLANQEFSTVEAFDAAARGEPIEQVLRRILEALQSGGTGDTQVVVFGTHGRSIAATIGTGMVPGEPRDGETWAQLSSGRVEFELPVTEPNGAILGTLVMTSNFPDVRPYTRSLAAAVARRAGLVLEAERSRDELRRRADSDALTGLCNRRFLFAQLDRTDLGAFAAVAFVDLNGFKTINDHHGHHFGDMVLVEVA